MTLGDTRKISFFQNCPKSLRIDYYGFCFRKWRSMTFPNGPGFCFRKWRSVTYPDFWLFSTLNFNIVAWWRHTCDVTSCTYTLTDTLSATYDVTVLSPCVTSQVTKIYFWILFPWMTLGENPKMLPIWVNVLYYVRLYSKKGSLVRTQWNIIFVPPKNSFLKLSWYENYKSIFLLIHFFVFRISFFRSYLT